MLNYFFDVELTYDNGGLFLCHAKYAHAVLVQAGFLNLKLACPYQAIEFLYAPTLHHFQDVKQILHYVKQTISFVYHFAIRGLLPYPVIQTRMVLLSRDSMIHQQLFHLSL